MFVSESASEMQDLRMNERGKIKNRERRRQILDFSRLLFNVSATPTDADFFLEINDKVYIIGEYKFMNAPLPHGQELALTRLCDALTETGRSALLFVAQHDAPVEFDVDGAAATVERLRYRYKWYSGKNATVGDIVTRFIIRYCDGAPVNGAYSAIEGAGGYKPGFNTKTAPRP